MLNVQKYLQTKTVDDLKNEYSISYNIDPEYPHLISLNYDQIKSPKIHDIVRECRGLILNTNDYSIVARSFNRFYNDGEAKNIVGEFVFQNALASEKVDGSLFLFFYDTITKSWIPASRKTTTARNSSVLYNGIKIPLLKIVAEYLNIEHEFIYEDREKLCINNYKQFIIKLNEVLSHLDKNRTYICELVSKYNKVVTEYNDSVLYFLASNDKDNNLSYENNTRIFKSIKRQKVTSNDDVKSFISELKKSNKLIEGVVLHNEKGQRVKIKTNTYVAVHLANGGKPSKRDIIRIAASNEEDEYLIYFPNHIHLFDKYIKIKNDYYKTLDTEYHRITDLLNSGQDRKSIAASCNNKTILGQIVKAYNNNQDLNDIKNEITENFLFKVLSNG